MAVIWGLDLKEIQWGKFKNSNMWNTTYHLRRTKFIVYQLAMIFCVVSESLGTAALSDYLDQQDDVARLNPNAEVHNNDFVGAFSYNIFVGVYVATIFGAAFFFDLFWPERQESKAVKIAWRVCSVLAVIFVASSAILLTVILFTHHAFITGLAPEEGDRLLEETHTTGQSPLSYRTNGRGIASVAFIWPGFLATIGSCILMFYSLAHIDQLGPFSTHARNEKSAYPPSTTDGTDRNESAVPTNAAEEPNANLHPGFEHA
ncbi:hypothetical protein K402DRAFT_404134 [Aulographum hederae CBS 113979]|uniref:Uncharacterized protein n=1 Tax=Aulographum hederae CBS 113979 TaxID=1176131 RepID=A0A6G1H0S9_9PEZI|nr:hypothetical protein K402DRAFT_404134 [Aulographum hederae CBS 113979]